MNEQTWWYGYDPNTFKYTGMRLSVEKPTNATSISFNGLIDPVWNPDTNTWTGQDLNVELQNIRETADANKNDKNEPIALLTETVANMKETTDTSLSTIMLQMASMQEQLAK